MLREKPPLFRFRSTTIPMLSPLLPAIPSERSAPQPCLLVIVASCITKGFRYNSTHGRARTHTRAQKSFCYLSLSLSLSFCRQRVRHAAAVALCLLAVEGDHTPERDEVLWRRYTPWPTPYVAQMYASFRQPPQRQANRNARANNNNNKKRAPLYPLQAPTPRPRRRHAHDAHVAERTRMHMTQTRNVFASGAEEGQASAPARCCRCCRCSSASRLLLLLGLREFLRRLLGGVVGRTRPRAGRAAERAEALAVRRLVRVWQAAALTDG